MYDVTVRLIGDGGHLIIQDADEPPRPHNNDWLIKKDNGATTYRIAKDKVWWMMWKEKTDDVATA